MAWTSFTTDYSIIDTIATDIPATTQSVLSKDSFVSVASSYEISSGLQSLSPQSITDRGLSQKALYELLLMYQVSWDEAMEALDAHPGVGSTNYAASCSLSSTDDLYGAYHSSFTGTSTASDLAVDQNSFINIQPNGIGTKELAVFLAAIKTQLERCCVNLDDDATITDTDYEAVHKLIFTPITGWIPPIAVDTAFDVTNPASKIQPKGIDRAALIDYLNTVVTFTNSLWVAIDADL